MDATTTEALKLLRLLRPIAGKSAVACLTDAGAALMRKTHRDARLGAFACAYDALDRAGFYDAADIPDSVCAVRRAIATLEADNA